jgi:hypothetical protein
MKWGTHSPRRLEKYSRPRNNSPKPGWKSQQGRQASRPATWPHVIWGLRTQPSKTTGQTPFFLIYGSEASLPADIIWKSPRVEMYNEGEANEARQLERTEETRCTALVQSPQYLRGIRRYHDHNVRERSFSIADLVRRRIQDESGLHKLNSRWEGPFIVKQITRSGSF